MNHIFTLTKLAKRYCSKECEEDAFHACDKNSPELLVLCHACLRSARGLTWYKVTVVYFVEKFVQSLVSGPSVVVDRDMAIFRYAIT